MFSLKQSENVAGELNYQRKNGLFCDAVIEAADGRKFPVHKSVIAAAAPKISSMFAWSSVVKMPSVDGNVLETILDYVYTGQITLNFSDKKTFDFMTTKFNEIAEIIGLEINKSNTNFSQINCKQEINSDNDEMPKSLPDDSEEFNKHVQSSTPAITLETGQNETLLEMTDSQHEEKHPIGNTDEKTYNCSYCEKQFYVRSRLKRHLDIHIEKLYKCQNCDQSFCDNSSLIKHLQSHDSKKPFKCQQCEKTYCRSGDLKIHMRTHTGEKPYKCQHCEKTFDRSGELIYHVRRTHTGEKPYKCEHCKKGFIRSGELRTHLRTHTGEKPYQCEHCEKSFSQNGTLRKHSRIHSGEKPYKCQHCEKSFRNGSDLVEHLRTHTDEKPYKCPNCKKSFRQRSGMKKHMKSHT